MRSLCPLLSGEFALLIFASALTPLRRYYNGCDGTGATCKYNLQIVALCSSFQGASGTCDTAFFNPNDNQVQVACQTDNVSPLPSLLCCNFIFLG